MYEAMDRQRIDRGLSWRQVADQIWEQSAELNRRRAVHPISPSTMTGIARRGDTTCQHALFFLRWLGRAPESFPTTPRADTDATRLPAAGAGRRLRWNLGAFHEALDRATAKYAIGMRLAMRIVVWVEEPAAAFVYAAEW